VPAYLVASRRADVSLVRKFTRAFVSCCFSHGVPKRGGNDDDMDIDLDDDTGDSRGGKKRSVVVKKPGCYCQVDSVNSLETRTLLTSGSL
jgi:hypothetical protein